MKRTLTVLLAVLLLLLVGCNTTKNDKSAEPEAPNEEAANEEAAEETAMEEVAVDSGEKYGGGGINLVSGISTGDLFTPRVLNTTGLLTSIPTELPSMLSVPGTPMRGIPSCSAE